MTANRDQRIWAVAHGKDIVVDDSNAPKQLPVKSNEPGPGPHGEFTFLDPVEATWSHELAQGTKANLFASEKEFPDLASPSK